MTWRPTWGKKNPSRKRLNARIQHDCNEYISDGGKILFTQPNITKKLLRFLTMSLTPVNETEDSSKVQRLQMRRKGYEAFAMRLIQEFDDICEMENYDYERIEVIDQHLHDKQKLLKELNETILALCDVEEIAGQIEESEEINVRIMYKRKKIKTMLENQTEPKPGKVDDSPKSETESQPTRSVEAAATGSCGSQQATVSNVETSMCDNQQQKFNNIDMTELPNIEQQHSINTQSTGVNHQNTHFGTKPKLPKITLPRFNGDVTKWDTFWDSFNSAIHTNTDIANIDKFNYLKSLIEGPAARTIQGLTLTNSNYETAIKLLEERFGKRQQIVSAHVDELLKIPSCSSDKSQSLRLVYDKISVHTRGLATLGISPDQYGSLLIPVMSKLPNEIRLQIAQMENR